MEKEKLLNASDFNEYAAMVKKNVDYEPVLKYDYNRIKATVLNVAANRPAELPAIISLAISNCLEGEMSKAEAFEEIVSGLMAVENLILDDLKRKVA